MSITKIPLQNLVARLLISPPPTTLGESTAVLKKLQSFGNVISFTKNPPQDSYQPRFPTNNEQLVVEVVFSCPQTIEAAQNASPFSVKVNHNLPDPNVEDPYNVRNLQSRKHPAPKTMVCHLKVHSADAPSGQNVLSNGYSPSHLTRLYQSLKTVKPPAHVLPGLAVFNGDKGNLRSTPEVVDPVPNLMEMYRSPPSDPASSRASATKSPSGVISSTGKS